LRRRSLPLNITQHAFALSSLALRATNPSFVEVVKPELTFPKRTPMLPAHETPAAALIAQDDDEKSFRGPRLTDKDAVEIWIARWLRVPLRVLVARFGCDKTRLYEVWWGERFPASRAAAEAEFRRRYPGLQDRTSFGYRKIARPGTDAGQLSLFD